MVRFCNVFLFVFVYKPYGEFMCMKVRIVNVPRLILLCKRGNLVSKYASPLHIQKNIRTFVPETGYNVQTI